MKIKILGSGTSSGVPIPGCKCKVCLSDHPRNTRLRTSALVSLEGSLSQAETNILIDTSTDLRIQALRANIRSIDAILYTHTHADHIFGFDDIRSFCFINPEKIIQLYASAKSAEDLYLHFKYAFDPSPAYEGGGLPLVSLNIIEDQRPWDINGHPVIPVPIYHGKLPVLGYRFGDFAYLTDCSHIPETSYPLLQNLKVLVLDALRFRPHPTHFSFDQAILEVEKLKPEHTYFTHLSHEVDYLEANDYLKANCSQPLELAWDGLEINL